MTIGVAFLAANKVPGARSLSATMANEPVRRWMAARTAAGKDAPACKAESIRCAITSVSVSDVNVRPSRANSWRRSR